MLMSSTGPQTELLPVPEPTSLPLSRDYVASPVEDVVADGTDADPGPEEPIKGDGMPFFTVS